MEELKPYLAFRNWLAEIRNHSSRRWPVRRNGTPLPGPFTLQTRAEILSEVEKLEAETHSTILLEGEREYIETLWKGDLKLEEQIMGASRAEA
jgi:DNA sulfur modification protein DndC